MQDFTVRVRRHRQLRADFHSLHEARRSIQVLDKLDDLRVDRLVLAIHSLLCNIRSILSRDFALGQVSLETKILNQSAVTASARID